MHKLFSHFISWILLLALATAVEAASDRAATDQVSARLLASVEAVRPGAEFYLGVHQQIIPHWHTYWSNPGDSGNPTTIEWSLPPGALAGDILWPAPSRFSMGPITNYGYENQVTLLTLVKAPSDLEVGGTFRVAALVDWLVCQEECIPQQVELELSLPVVAVDAADAGPGEGNALIDEALARLPVANPYPLTASQSVASEGQKSLVIDVVIPQVQIPHIQDIWFYPYEWGRIQQSAPQHVKTTDQGVSLVLQVGEAPLSIAQQLSGVLVIQEAISETGALVARGFEVDVTLNESVVAVNAEVSSVLGAMLLALLGGLILNLMPCVFPVLSIKALSLISHADQSPRQIRFHGLAYTLGVVGSFVLLALVLIALKSAGNQIGWGFQYQSPLFVAAVAYLMFAVGLSLSGVFYLGGAAAGVGSSLAEKPGYQGSFFTGVLATIVATPCTAPFMAAALGYALAQPSLVVLAVFSSLGFGLALPYLLLTHWPRLQRWLPRPGAWMEQLKQLLAFPMYAAAIWLVWVLVQQAGIDALIVALGGMLAISLAAWIYTNSRSSGISAQRLGTIASLLLVTAVIATTVSNFSAANNTADKSVSPANSHWEAFSEARLTELQADGKAVFVNFTAAWCISCLVNEKVALSDSAVIDAFTSGEIHYLKGDWTNRDPHITAFLARFNRSGVPLYLFYPAGESTPQVLPQILTPDIVIAAVKKTAP